MSLLELRSKTRKAKKRVGRGNGSGKGTYSCRGMKGQSARSGGRRRPGFEGGQTPYLRKIPKLKGFKNPNKIDYQIINTGQLNIFDNNIEIKKEDLLLKNLISKKNIPVKLLAGKGELEKTVKIYIDKASNQAIKTIEDKKGKIFLPEEEEKDIPKKEPKKTKTEKK